MKKKSRKNTENLSLFASAEGTKDGEFFPLRCMVKLLLEIPESHCGHVYDRCGDSLGLFMQSAESNHLSACVCAQTGAHTSGNGNSTAARQAAGRTGRGMIADSLLNYAQKSSGTTCRLATMNLFIRGIDGQIAHGDTFHNDCRRDLKANVIFTKPPAKLVERDGERLKENKPSKYRLSPKGNANVAGVQQEEAPV